MQQPVTMGRSEPTEREGIVGILGGRAACGAGTFPASCCAWTALDADSARFPKVCALRSRTRSGRANVRPDTVAAGEAVLSESNMTREMLLLKVRKAHCYIVSERSVEPDRGCGTIFWSNPGSPCCRKRSTDENL